MKLASVSTFVVQTPPPHSGGALWFFVKLETEDGLVGWGETAILAALHTLEDSYEKLVQQVFEGYLKGRDPMDREALYHKMYEGMMAQHPDYVGMGVVSAFDIALWDIVGKHFNTPVYNLLGGKYRERIRTYTYVYDNDGPGGTVGTWTGNPERLGMRAAELADEGFTGLKFDPLPQSAPRRLPTPPWEVSLAEYEAAVNAVAAVRAAVGTRADILIGTMAKLRLRPRGALPKLSNTIHFGWRSRVRRKTINKWAKLRAVRVSQSPPASGWWGFMNFRTCLNMEAALLPNRSWAVVVV